MVESCSNFVTHVLPLAQRPQDSPALSYIADLSETDTLHLVTDFVKLSDFK